MKEVFWGIIFREVPKIGEYFISSERNINDFFMEYERYCKEKYGDRKHHWFQGLG